MRGVGDGGKGVVYPFTSRSLALVQDTHRTLLAVGLNSMAKKV